jgi:hypothetical protein
MKKSLNDEIEINQFKKGKKKSEPTLTFETGDPDQELGVSPI